MTELNYNSLRYIGAGPRIGSVTGTVTELTGRSPKNYRGS
jgi:hypothetical protein